MEAKRIRVWEAQSPELNFHSTQYEHEQLVAYKSILIKFYLAWNLFHFLTDFLKFPYRIIILITSFTRRSLIVRSFAFPCRQILYCCLKMTKRRNEYLQYGNLNRYVKFHYKINKVLVSYLSQGKEQKSEREREEKLLCHGDEDKFWCYFCAVVRIFNIKSEKKSGMRRTKSFCYHWKRGASIWCRSARLSNL